MRPEILSPSNYDKELCKPKEYGKYLVIHKDGTAHIEV